MVKVIGIGLACLDYLLQVPDLSTVHQGGRLQGFKVQGGGMAATAMVAVARLGGQAELWTVVGDDTYGPMIEAELLAENVDLSQLIRTDQVPSHVTFVLVDGQTGERVFLSAGQSRQNRQLGLVVEPDLNRIDQADAVLVDGLWQHLSFPALQRARACGIPTIGDIEYFEGNERLLPLIDYLVIPEEAAMAYAGSVHADALHSLAAFGARMVVITRGAQGAIYWTDGLVGEVPAFTVDVIDTTGAGDVFHGAFVYGMTVGWRPDQLVYFASAAAALNCTSLGGRSGIPTFDQTRQFLAEQMPDTDLSWLKSAKNSS